MDKNKNKMIEFKSWSLNLSDSNFIKILKNKRDKKFCFIKENKGIKIALHNKMGNNKSVKVSKFIYNYNKNNVFIKNIKNIVLIFFINIILLNIN